MPPTIRQWLKYFDADTVTRLSHLGFSPAGLVEGHLVGDHRSPFHGFAIEFAGHRQYVPGDDLKHLDWRAYARTGRHLIKQYEQETNFNAHLLIDTSATMAFDYRHGRRFDYAAFIAVAISQLVVNQSDCVAAYLFDRVVRTEIATSNSEDVVHLVNDACVRAETKEPSSLGDVLCVLAERLRRRQIVFVISDLFAAPDDTFRGVKRLLDDRHEVVLVQVLDPLEVEFSIPGRVRLLDLEGAGKLNLTGQAVRDSYHELFHGFLAELERQSTSLGVDYVRCVTDKPFGYYLAEYLSRRRLRYLR
jgi:uncharacterized protein (DUF58 family)